MKNVFHFVRARYSRITLWDIVFMLFAQVLAALVLYATLSPWGETNVLRPLANAVATHGLLTVYLIIGAIFAITIGGVRGAIATSASKPAKKD